MRDSTVEYLTARLPEIRAMVDDGLQRAEICARLHCSHPTLRTFLQQHGIVLKKQTRHVIPTAPGTWHQFIPRESSGIPFTDAALKCRRMAEHSPEEIEAIRMKIQARVGETVPRTRRRPKLRDSSRW